MALDPAKLARRAVTGVIGVVIIIVLVFFLPKWCFVTALFGIGVVGVKEFRAISGGFGFPIYEIPVYITLALGMATLYTDRIDLLWLPHILLTLVCLVSLIPPVHVKRSLPRVGITLVTAAYMGLTVLPMAYIFNMTDADGNGFLGRVLAMFTLVIVWAGDTAAYFAGSLLGAHKIAPVVSPKKTYEGTAGNLVGNLIAVIVAKYWFLPQLSWTDVVVLTVIFGLLGFWGDLTESSWKRGSGIKDSGGLFPGHGGVLDRVDSIFMTAPIFYFYLNHFVL